MSAVPSREAAPPPSCGRWLLALRRARRRQTPREHRGSLIRLAASQVMLLLLLVMAETISFEPLAPLAGVTLPRSSSRIRGHRLDGFLIELAPDRALVEGGRWTIPLSTGSSCMGEHPQLPGFSVKHEDLVASPLGVVLQELKDELGDRPIGCTKCGRRYGCPCDGEPEHDIILVADGQAPSRLIVQVVKTAHALNLNVRLLVAQDG